MRGIALKIFVHDCQARGSEWASEWVGGGESLSRLVSSSAPLTRTGQLLCAHTVATWALSQLSLGPWASSWLFSNPLFPYPQFFNAITTHHPVSLVLLHWTSWVLSKKCKEVGMT